MLIQRIISAMLSDMPDTDDANLTAQELCYKIAYEALMHYSHTTNWHLCNTSGYTNRHYGYVTENHEQLDGFAVARKAIGQIWDIQNFDNIAKKAGK